MAATANPFVQEFDECGKPIDLVASQAKLDDAAAKGKCVAFYNQKKVHLPSDRRQDPHQTWYFESLACWFNLGPPRKQK